MEMAVSDAKAVLTDLIRRAEAGEEVVLTRHGRPVAHIVAIRARPDLGGRTRRGRKTISMTSTACQRDRAGYLGHHGNPVAGTQRPALHRRPHARSPYPHQRRTSDGGLCGRAGPETDGPLRGASKSPKP